jgi:hypothetical protein
MAKPAKKSSKSAKKSSQSRNYLTLHPIPPTELVDHSNPTFIRVVLAGSETSTNFRWWYFRSLGREPCRSNVNYPPTAVGGICRG